MARRPRVVTPYQRAVLSTLEGTGARRVEGLGGSVPHLVHALRRLEEQGLVSGNLSQRWSITQAGRDLLEAP
jgi:hypothetical protein